MTPAKDPYRYFRVEARELLEGLVQGVLQLEKGTAAPDAQAPLLRLAHTLKGAARVVKLPAIAEATHTIEGVLLGHRDAGGSLSPAQGTELWRLLDSITAQLDLLDPPAPRAPSRGPPGPPVEEPLETLRVEIREMDALLRAVTEAGVQLGALGKAVADTDRMRDLAAALVEQLAATRTGAEHGRARVHALADDLQAGLDHLQRGLAVHVERVAGDLGVIHEVTDRLRLVAAQSVFPSLDRAVRDAAEALGKRASFEASGGDVRLDANVLASMRDALLHVVRNAVTHGLETDAGRASAGKGPAGQVRLAVTRNGSRVVFTCTDDGRGIDVQAVQRAAVARGLVSAADAPMETDAAVALLAAGGLSTSASVTELSGRGIGLDVLRATTARLKGEIRIRSEPGAGVTVMVEVPLSMASMRGLVVEASGVLAAIPLDAVREALRATDADMARSARSDAVVHGGVVFPFVPLERALGRPASGGPRRSARLCVIVEAGGRKVAVGVDRILGTGTIVMRALPGFIQADAVVSGASLDAEGHPRLVLDPQGLVAAAERGAGPPLVAAPVKRAPLLVIDDSLTTRMLEQSILEAAGYEVAVAVSAEEGIAAALERRYGLFIVDVEMPGMNGFEFVAQTRADPVLRDVPAILVTSRGSAEDRRRGEQAGARAYIVKGEFDQGHFLQTVRSLIGP